MPICDSTKWLPTGFVMLFSGFIAEKLLYCYLFIKLFNERSTAINEGVRYIIGHVLCSFLSKVSV